MMEQKKKAKIHEDLKVYQIAFEAAMQIFEISKQFPMEERYSLTDQIRRSSRSVVLVNQSMN
jgi:23S rRNA-intervening sequence protein